MQQFIMPDLKYFLRRKHYVSSTIFLILFSVLFLNSTISFPAMSGSV